MENKNVITDLEDMPLHLTTVFGFVPDHMILGYMTEESCMFEGKTYTATSLASDDIGEITDAVEAMEDSHRGILIYTLVIDPYDPDTFTFWFAPVD